MPKKPYTYEPPRVVEEPAITQAASEPPPIESALAAPSAEEALTKRLTDYVHHRLNQHLPTAVEWYVQELRDVFAGKAP